VGLGVRVAANVFEADNAALLGKLHEGCAVQRSYDLVLPPIKGGMYTTYQNTARYSIMAILPRMSYYNENIITFVANNCCALVKQERSKCHTCDVDLLGVSNISAII
jgi:hypothetical protein